MNIKEAILILLNSGDKIVRGRTMVQKRLYFFEVLTEERLTGRNFGFSPHYYGPYSSLVSVELDSLVASGLVEGKANVTGLSNVFGQVIRHDYSLTEEGQELADAVLREYPSAAEEFDRITATPVGRNISEISAAAKVHFVVSSRKREISESEISEAAQRLGWSLNKTQIQDVLHYLSSDLELLTVTRG